MQNSFRYPFELVQREGGDALAVQGSILFLNLFGTLGKSAGSIPQRVKPVDSQQVILWDLKRDKSDQILKL